MRFAFVVFVLACAVSLSAAPFDELEVWTLDYALVYAEGVVSVDTLDFGGIAYGGFYIVSASDVVVYISLVEPTMVDDTVPTLTDSFPIAANGNTGTLFFPPVSTGAFAGLRHVYANAADSAGVGDVVRMVVWGDKD